MDKNKVLFKNIASLGIVQIINYIFPLITIPYVSRIIGPSGFGIINYITAFVSYFILIISFGFDFTATRKLTLKPESYKLRSTLYSLVTGSRIILFVLCCLLFAIFLFNIKILNDNKLLSCVLFLNVFTPLLTPQYIFQGLQRLNIYSFITVIKGIISTILIFLFITKKEDLLLYACINVFSNFIVNSMALGYIIVAVKIKFVVYPLKKYFKTLKESRYVFFSSVVFSLYTTANIVILGFFDNSVNIGYYSTALSFITIVQSIINIPLASSLFPYIGKSFANSKEEGIDRLSRILPIVFYLTLFVSILLILLAPLFVNIIYGDKFKGSIISVQILAFVPLLSSFSGLLGVQTMLNLALDKVFLRVTFFAAIFSIILNIMMAKYYRYVGTSISYLFTEMLIVIALFLTLKKKNINIINPEHFHPKRVLSILKKLLK